MTVTTAAVAPLYSPQLFLALRKVSRGRIGATALDGALHQQSEELSTSLFAALFSLKRDGFISLAEPTAAAPGWYQAVLTLRGTQLLSSWALRQTHLPAPVLAAAR
jgi:hypothetical protein